LGVGNSQEGKGTTVGADSPWLNMGEVALGSSFSLFIYLFIYLFFQFKN